MRLATPLAIAVLLAALLAGCGGSDDGGSESTASRAPQASDPSAPAGASASECMGGEWEAARLRATGISCSEGFALLESWQEKKGCTPAASGSRSACTIAGSYRCLAVVTDRGTSVSCAQPGRSVAFTVKRD